MRMLQAFTTGAMALTAVLFGAAQAPSTPADPLADAVRAYASYQADISELRGRRVGNASDLDAVIDQSARHNRDTLSRGWIAYGAYAAAQSPTFVRGVRAAAERYGRERVIWALTANPRYASTLPGAADANRLLLASAHADGARIAGVADRYRELAYSLQRQGWASARAPGQVERVARVRAASAGETSYANLGDTLPRLAPAPESLSLTDPAALGGRRFWDNLRGGAQVTEAAATVTPALSIEWPRAEALYRMTALAALHTLGATRENPTAVQNILNESRSRNCLELSRMQLLQCFSAARFRYENAFCVSQHALRDVGRCVGAVAHSDTPAPASAH